MVYFLFSVPVKTFRSLKLVWPLGPQQKYYLEKPNNYISHLLGHEGSGSLFSLLKKKGWATALVSGVSTSTTDFDLFKIDIDLTEQGFRTYSTTSLLLICNERG
jgi:insulysin